MGFAPQSRSVRNLPTTSGCGQAKGKEAPNDPCDFKALPFTSNDLPAGDLFLPPVLMASSKDFQEFDAAILADRLGFIALSLFAVYAITLVAGILPVRLLDTAWQLRFISASLDTAPIPLVGLGLFHLAAYLDPGNAVLQRRRDGVARLAVLAVIGFLLTLPLQAYAAWNNVATARATVARQLSAATATFDLLQDTITTASNLDNLQARLQAIQAPSLGVPFQELGLPLPEARRRLLARLGEIRADVDQKIRAEAPGAIGLQIRDSLRAMLSALALAFAFAMGAQRRGSEVPLLVEWHTRLSLQGPRGAPSAAGLLPGLSLPGRTGSSRQDAYLSQLLPEEDDTSETGFPPAP